jgi:acyl-CoA thioesterase FadM
MRCTRGESRQLHGRKRYGANRMHKLRQLKLLIRAVSEASPSDPLRPIVRRFRVMPSDVELTRLVNHAYVALAGLGRWAWCFQNIHWKGLFKERWVPFTQSELVHYRRAIKIFTMVDVTTTLIWWDEKMAYLEHRITQGDTVSALVFARGTFFKGKDRLAPNRCIAGLPTVPPMSQPAVVEYWNSGAEYFKQAL